MGFLASGKKRILLIEDDPMQSMFVSEALCEDFKVDTALDGASGTEAAIAKPPDLILLDFDMPGMDGGQALQILRASPKTKDVPVIMVTGRSSLDAVEEMLGKGASDYVTKPVELANLMTKIDRVLGA